MPEDLGDKGMAEGMDTIARHTSLKIGNLKQCQNYRAISLISHPSKIMLLVIFNRPKAEAEELPAEQAGFGLGRSIEQIFNSRVVLQKHLHATLVRSVPQLHRLQEGV